jgi:arrestin-related trafficking adapter 3/6
VIQPTENLNGRRLWPVVKPGRYAYDFELSLNQPLPETFNVGGCKLKYNIQALASISGLRRHVSQRREVSVVHCPQEELYLHEANQISLSRIWNRRITYHVELSNRSAPIGGKVPIAVRIGCSDILFVAVQIYLAQKIKFPGTPGKQTQIRKKLLLRSKCNDLSTGKFTDTLLSLNLDREPGMTLISGNVPLQDEPKTALRLHPDVNSKIVKATHTMIVSTLSTYCI